MAERADLLISLLINVCHCFIKWPTVEILYIHNIWEMLSGSHHKKVDSKKSNKKQQQTNKDNNNNKTTTTPKTI